MRKAFDLEVGDLVSLMRESTGYPDHGNGTEKIHISAGDSGKVTAMDEEETLVSFERAGELWVKGHRLALTGRAGKDSGLSRSVASKPGEQTSDFVNIGYVSDQRVKVVEMGAVGFSENTEDGKEFKLQPGERGTVKTVTPTGMAVLVEFDDPATGRLWVPSSALLPTEEARGMLGHDKAQKAGQRYQLGDPVVLIMDAPAWAPGKLVQMPTGSRGRYVGAHASHGVAVEFDDEGQLYVPESAIKPAQNGGSEKGARLTMRKDYASSREFLGEKWDVANGQKSLSDALSASNASSDEDRDWIFDMAEAANVIADEWGETWLHDWLVNDLDFVAGGNVSAATLDNSAKPIYEQMNEWMVRKFGTVDEFQLGKSASRGEGGSMRTGRTMEKKKYPWDKCIADQKKAGHSEESSKKICASIKLKNQKKSLRWPSGRPLSKSGPRTVGEIVKLTDVALEQYGDEHRGRTFLVAGQPLPGHDDFTYHLSDSDTGAQLPFAVKAEDIEPADKAALGSSLSDYANRLRALIANLTGGAADMQDEVVSDIEGLLDEALLTLGPKAVERLAERFKLEERYGLELDYTGGRGELDMAGVGKDGDADVSASENDADADTADASNSEQELFAALVNEARKGFAQKIDGNWVFHSAEVEQHGNLTEYADGILEGRGRVAIVAKRLGTEILETVADVKWQQLRLPEGDSFEPYLELGWAVKPGRGIVELPQYVE